MKNHLLTIGISQYPYWGDLNNASNDAKQLSNLLIEKYQFEKETLQELLDEDATFDGIMYHLDNYLYNLNSQDNLVIIFCGHGYFDGLLNEGYWVPHDGKKGNRVSMIPVSTIEKFIGAIKGHHILVIADSCFSGSLFRGETIYTPHEKLFKIPSRWALTSGRLETVSDGPKGKHSPFVQSIISKLTMEDKKPLSIAELSNTVLQEVGASKEQTPRGEPLKLMDHKGGQFIFYLKNQAIELIQKPELENKEIPEQIVELFKKYNTHLDNEAPGVRDIKDETLAQLSSEIDKSLEEYKFENSENINKLLDIKEIDNLQSQLRELRNKKNNAVRSQQYETAAQLRDDEIQLVFKNQKIVDSTLDSFKNKCAELVDGNIYVLYSFISQHIDDLPFLYIKHKDEIQRLLKRKFIIEITKKANRMSNLDIRLSDNTVNTKILEALKNAR